MRLTVRSEELDAEAALMRQKRLQLVKRLKVEMRKVSLALERRIKLEMPVDTGRARASWGHWSPGDLRGGSQNASPSDAVYDVKDDGLTIQQGSNVEYMEDLNAGRSTQAPRGFLDVAERWAIEELDKEVDEVMRLW